MFPANVLDGDRGARLLIVADHASSHVPGEIDLGIDDALLGEHIALDIGVDELSRRLNADMGWPALLGGVSRLVIDLNREVDAPGLIPAESDGHPIPGNTNLSEEARNRRIADYWGPYHRTLGAVIAERNPLMLVSLHSFTPRLQTSDMPRPWQVGVLYNEDDRAARIALPLLDAAGVIAGDNLPYSGKILNATMNHHAEGAGIAYLGLEVRQDLIGDADGVTRWAKILRPIISQTAEKLASSMQERQ